MIVDQSDNVEGVTSVTGVTALFAPLPTMHYCLLIYNIYIIYNKTITFPSHPTISTVTPVTLSRFLLRKLWKLSTTTEHPYKQEFVPSPRKICSLPRENLRPAQRAKNGSRNRNSNNQRPSILTIKNYYKLWNTWTWNTGTGTCFTHWVAWTLIDNEGLVVK